MFLILLSKFLETEILFLLESEVLFADSSFDNLESEVLFADSSVKSGDLRGVFV